jgi:BRCT domain type II-containing protein
MSSSREKLELILRSKTGLTQEQISSISDGDGWRLVYEASPNRRADRVEICFTGFTAPEKEEMELIATRIGMTVVQQVNMNLRYLCIGDKPGPAKMDLAKQRRKKIISKDEFLLLVETGEL